ncbi:MAG: trimeric intracellular cation channel family protein, partial [Halomonas venusta]|nr:trimeric intracellular cation channel family protein [Halomonas venusta]
GGIVYVALDALQAPLTVAIAAALTATLGLRLAAIHWHLALPVFAWVTLPPKTQDEASAPLSTPQKAKERVRMIRRERKKR